MDSLSWGMLARFAKKRRGYPVYPHIILPTGHDEREIAVTLLRNVGHAFREITGHDGAKYAIDAEMLSDWVAKARTLASAKGLGDICDQRIAYAPQDADAAFWPPSAVCQVIDAVAAEHVERGFAIECFNKRGVYRKGINEGGGQEREFAARYKGWADATLMYPRTSAMLMAISDDWVRRAKHEDVRAEQGKMKM